MDILSLILFWVLFDFVYIFYRLILLIKHTKKSKDGHHQLVSILIPAYNEELCIERTLTSCIKQTYPRLEILIINDGSTDKTLEVVNDFIMNNHTQISSKNIFIKIINQKNRGKARALNNGKAHSKGEFIVTIDADSFLHPGAIKNIIPYFSDKKIGAVAGNVVALSNNSFLGYLQKIEYELGIYFIRNSQSSIGNVMVTPGALSAYRKNALRNFEEGTLTEDFDSSVRILEKGYRIVMSTESICYTQVPLGFRDLIKQRVRWQQGGLEVFSKHIFHDKSVSVLIEWVFLFLFGFYALFSKVIALLIIPLSLISGDYLSVIYVLSYFFIYSIIIYSILFTITAYYSKDKKAILAVPAFIVYYHTIVLYSVLVAQILALKGGKQSWEKIKRYPI